MIYHPTQTADAGTDPDMSQQDIDGNEITSDNLPDGNAALDAYEAYKRKQLITAGVIFLAIFLIAGD